MTHRFNPATPAVLCGLIVLCCATLLGATPQIAAAGPDAADAPAPWELSFEMPQAEPTVSTAEQLPWLTSDDLRWKRDRAAYWNQRYLPGIGSVGLFASYNMWEGRDEEQQDPYLQNAAIEEGLAALRIAGNPYPGVRIFLDVGSSMVQLKPFGDDSFDRYNLGTMYGAGVQGGIPVGSFAVLELEISFLTHENESNEPNNALVANNGGGTVKFRKVTIQPRFDFVVEVWGEQGSGSIALHVGGGYDWLFGFIEGGDVQLNVRQLGQQEWFAEGGLTIGIADVFSLRAEVRVARAELLHARLEISGYIR